MGIEDALRESADLQAALREVLAQRQRAERAEAEIEKLRGWLRTTELAIQTACEDRDRNGTWARRWKAAAKRLQRRRREPDIN